MHRPLVLLSLLASLLFVSLLVVAPGRASAQAGGPRMHIGAGLAIDFGGEVDLQRTREFGYGGDNLNATVGVRGHLDYAVHRHVSVGGLVRMSWWKPDYLLSIDRSFLLDLGPRVIGHYDWRDFRFYGGMSPGLTLSAIGDDGINVENPAAGFTMSLTLAGMEWWFSRRAGLFVELGWVGHWFEHDNAYVPGGLDFHISQGLFELGFVFAP